MDKLNQAPLAPDGIHIENWSVTKFQVGIAIGMLDGLLGTIQFLWESGRGLWSCVKSAYNYTVDKFSRILLQGEAVSEVLGEVWSDASQQIQATWDNIVKTYDLIVQIVTVSLDQWRTILDKIITAVKTWMVNFIEGTPEVGYGIGLVVFELVIAYFSGGSKTGSQFVPRIMDWLRDIKSATNNKLVEMIDNARYGAGNYVSSKLARAKCVIYASGCFVAGTKVAIANNPRVRQFGLGLGMMAMALSGPVAAEVPIEDVEILSYVATNESVNRNAYDPFTSPSQVERDEYSNIEGEVWYAVTFEQQHEGTTTAQLAFPKVHLEREGYQEGVTAHLNLPEQNISGLFLITNIRRVVLPKKPVDEDGDDDYDYGLVTGLFTHQSDEVYSLRFENGDTLGVTYLHPIYSATRQDWQFAGDLLPGEEVMTQNGPLRLREIQKLPGQRTVYNLEVKDYHNYLVGEQRILVHNACSNKDVRNFLEGNLSLNDIPDEDIRLGMTQLNGWKNGTTEDQGRLNQLLQDFTENVTPVSLGPKGVEAYRAVYSRPNLRKDDQIIFKAKSVLDRGLGNFDLEDIVVGNKTNSSAYTPALSTLLDNLEAFLHFKTSNNFYTVIDQLKIGGNQHIGTNWVMKFSGKGPLRQASPGDVRFEFRTSLPGNPNERIFDILYEDGQFLRVFECKSVLPENALTTANRIQFQKDLSLPHVQSLEELIWAFDGEKLPNGLNFEPFINAVVVDQQTINKFMANNSSLQSFRSLLIQKQSEIFQIYE